jgi:hypothetical protein
VLRFVPPEDERRLELLLELDAVRPPFAPA